VQFFYIMDPMCSWCYAFSHTLAEIEPELPAETSLQYVMGGLAPDSAEPMPPQTRQYVQSAWRAVADRTGAAFNFDFWEKCVPRRATYPACRAVITAGLQAESAIPNMVQAIQTAYYRQARNPSEESTLTELAGEIGLDAARFTDELHSPLVEQRLRENFAFKNSLGVQGFPTLVLEKEENYYALAVGYVDTPELRRRLETAMRL
jgi:putative protein-disulfide isomerase